MQATAAKTIDARLSFNATTELYRLEFAAMGTDCRALLATADREQAISCAREIVQWVADFETKYTRFNESSLIGQINRQAGVAPVPLDADADRMFDICESLYQSTNGILDVTALPIIALWESRRALSEIPNEREIQRALGLVGWPKVERRPGWIFLPRAGMSLDLGGWGKEYAVDEAWRIADGFGIRNVLIDFGRDIRAAGSPARAAAWTVGLEDPARLDHARFNLRLNDAAVATSGNYRRAFAHDGALYGHIVDPRVGRPAGRSALSATVIASTCLHAGKLSTLACVLGAEQGIQEIETSLGSAGCMIHQSKIFVTKGFYEYAIET